MQKTVSRQSKGSSIMQEKGILMLVLIYYRVLFELILMDLLMPKMNGYDATQEIRSIETEMKFSSADKHYICGFSAEVTP